jgi:hypothetical protein
VLRDGLYHTRPSKAIPPARGERRRLEERGSVVAFPINSRIISGGFEKRQRGRTADPIPGCRAAVQ